MSLRLSDLSACFEGVIPSIIATASADGMPNISYLSHVVRIDEEHVALSNQFFAKTAANVRANPKVTLILVDGFTGDQFLLDIGFMRSVDAGPLFDRIALQLKASSAQVGMSEVMRLRSADVFRVHGIEKVPSPVETAPGAVGRDSVSLPALSDAIKALERQADADEIIDSLLGGVQRVLGYDNALVLIHDSHRGSLVTTGSIGYERSGLGSEIASSEGLIGSAATNGQTIKVNDMSRVRRLGEAISLEAEASENATRVVTFPQLPRVVSQIAVPMVARNTLIGVLFIESTQRLAFREEDEAALEIDQRAHDVECHVAEVVETLSHRLSASPACRLRVLVVLGERGRVAFGSWVAGRDGCAVFPGRSASAISEFPTAGSPDTLNVQNPAAQNSEFAAFAESRLGERGGVRPALPFRPRRACDPHAIVARTSGSASVSSSVARVRSTIASISASVQHSGGA